MNKKKDETPSTAEVNDVQTANTEEKKPKAEKSEKKKNDEAAKKLLTDLLAENEALKGENEKMKKEAAEQKDMYLRLMAEYDNFRKRTAAEKSAIYADASSEVIEKMLPVLDNLERAAEASGSTDADSAIRSGVELVLKSFRETLEKMGVSEIPALGETFDPNLHNAVMKEDDPEKGENEVTAVFQKGYKLGSKVIRYAMVKVAN